MALKKFNPTTPSQRNLVLVDKSDLYKGKPVKKLTVGLSKTGGRNNSGHVTSWQKGGGHKRRYRMVDFKRTKTGIMATVERLEYDPNRTAFIALITYDDGEQSYILAPQRLSVGDKVSSGVGADIKPGNALPLANIPVGTSDSTRRKPRTRPMSTVSKRTSTAVKNPRNRSRLTPARPRRL